MGPTTATPSTARSTIRSAMLRANSARHLAAVADRRSRIDAAHSVMYRREAIRLRALAAEWQSIAGRPALHAG